MEKNCCALLLMEIGSDVVVDITSNDENWFDLKNCQSR